MLCLERLSWPVPILNNHLLVDCRKPRVPRMVRVLRPNLLLYFDTYVRLIGNLLPRAMAC